MPTRILSCCAGKAVAVRAAIAVRLVILNSKSHHRLLRSSNRVLFWLRDVLDGDIIITSVPVVEENVQAYRRQVQRVLASHEFAASRQLREFLQYVSEAALEGRTHV